MHKKLNASLWKADFISSDFGDLKADLLNCKDSMTSNGSIKEFWDGFEEVSSMLYFVFVYGYSNLTNKVQSTLVCMLACLFVQ